MNLHKRNCCSTWVPRKINMEFAKDSGQIYFLWAKTGPLWMKDFRSQPIYRYLWFSNCSCFCDSFPVVSSVAWQVQWCADVKKAHLSGDWYMRWMFGIAYLSGDCNVLNCECNADSGCADTFASQRWNLRSSGNLGNWDLTVAKSA